MRAHRRGRTPLGIVALLVVTLTLSSCSGSGTTSPTTAPTSSSGGTSTDPGDAATQAGTFAALDPEARDALLVTTGASVERAAMTMSGLEEALGGPAKADAAYAAITAAMLRRALAYRTRPSWGRFGGSGGMADVPSQGTMMTVAILVSRFGTEGVIAATANAPVKSATQNLDPGSGTNFMNITGSLGRVGMDVRYEETVGGVTGTMHIVLDVTPCPDAQGVVTVRAKLTTSINGAGGTTGSTMTADVTVTGHVNDDAELVSHENVTHTVAGDHAGGGATFLDQTATTTWVGDSVDSANRVVNQTAGQGTPTFTKDAGTWTGLIEQAVSSGALEAASKAWKSGRCVRLVPTTEPSQRSGLKPGATVSIAAEPRSRIDGGTVGGTVAATLTGAESVAPSGSKVPADATFTYIAPSEIDTEASVSLESRSKRGVATAVITFDTNASRNYLVKPATDVAVIIGTATGFNLSGTTPKNICDLGTRSFTLTGPLATVQKFTPTTPPAGTTTFSTAGNGVPIRGSGTYVIEFNGANATLTTTMTGTIFFPGRPVPHSWSQVFALDPIEGRCA